MGILKKLVYKDILNDLTKNSNILHEVSEKEKQLLQLCLLEIYQDINSVCEKNNIKPFLVGGSALGAVRHKGFIPWDDDLDIAMSRKDYRLFISIFDKELSDKYILRAPNSSDIATNRFVQVYKKGTKYSVISSDNTTSPNMIYMDIFPVDYASNKRFIQVLKSVWCNALMIISSAVDLHVNYSARLEKFMKQTKIGKVNYELRDLIGCIFSLVKPGKWFNMVDNAVAIEKKSKYCTIAVGRKHYLGELLPSDVFFPVKKIKFEGLAVYVPNKVEKYLENLYGDYMRIPPVEKREQHFVIDIGFEEKNDTNS